MQEILLNILKNWDEYAQAVFTVIGVFSFVAANVGHPKKGSVLSIIRGVVDLIGQNYGKAKNEVKK